MGNVKTIQRSPIHFCLLRNKTNESADAQIDSSAAGLQQILYFDMHVDTQCGLSAPKEEARLRFIRSQHRQRREEQAAARRDVIATFTEHRSNQLLIAKDHRLELHRDRLSEQQRAADQLVQSKQKRRHESLASAAAARRRMESVHQLELSRARQLQEARLQRADAARSRKMAETTARIGTQIERQFCQVEANRARIEIHTNILPTTGSGRGFQSHIAEPASISEESSQKPNACGRMGGDNRSLKANRLSLTPERTCRAELSQRVLESRARVDAYTDALSKHYLSRFERAKQIGEDVQRLKRQ